MNGNIMTVMIMACCSGAPVRPRWLWGARTERTELPGNFFPPKCDCATQFEGHVISQAGSVAWRKPRPRGTSESAPFTALDDGAGGGAAFGPDITGWKGLVFATAECGDAAFFFFFISLLFYLYDNKTYGTAAQERLFTRFLNLFRGFLD